MDPQGWQPFTVTVSTEGDRATVVLKGELDLAGIDSAKQAIDQAEEVPGRMVVLDLSELTFMDSTGLEVVLRAARRASESGRRLVVARPSHYVKRLLKMTAIDQSLDIVEDEV
jgi:anti-sigma B factor antagonist